MFLPTSQHNNGVTVDGFDFVGGIPHIKPETKIYEKSKCRNWWTNPNSYVKRNIFMDNYVFSVANNSFDIAHTDDPKTVLNKIELNFNEQQ